MCPRSRRFDAGLVGLGGPDARYGRAYSGGYPRPYRGPHRIPARLLDRAPPRHRAPHEPLQGRLGGLHDRHPVRRHPFGRRRLLGQVLGCAHRIADQQASPPLRPQHHPRLSALRHPRRRAHQDHQRLPSRSLARASGDRDLVDRRWTDHSRVRAHRAEAQVPRRRQPSLLEVHPDRVLPVPRHAARRLALRRDDPRRRTLRGRAQSGRRLHVLPRGADDARRDGPTNSTRTGAA